MLRTVLRTTASNKTTCPSLYSTFTTQAQAQTQGQQPLQKKRLLIKDIRVTPDEDGMRIDRFLRHRLAQDPDWPPVNNVVISKWLRQRQVKLLAPIPTTTTSTATDDLQLPEGAQSNIEGLVEEVQAKEKVRIHASTATRTEAGQLWRVRGVVEASLATEATGPGQVNTSTGASPLSHTVPTTPPLKPCLPLEDWVVYKDERIIVINKPSGISVQGGTGVTASIDSFLPVLQYGYPEKPRLVHRLDKTTSGILVLARTRKAAQDLSSRFQDGTKASPGNKAEGSTSRIQKKYVAIVGSTHPVKEPYRHRKHSSGSEPFRLRGDMLMMTEGKTQTIQMSPSKKVTKTLATKSVWPSVTDVVIAAQCCQSGTYWALLNLYPRTGRKHQLRVHCAQLLNAPILGDVKYSGTEMKADDGITSRIYLHMAELELKGWVANAESHETRTLEGRNYRITKDGSLVLTAKLEGDMQRAMERLGLS